MEATTALPPDTRGDEVLAPPIAMGWGAVRTALAVLLSLQLLDVLTTRAVLSRGGVEGSHLSQLLLSTWGYAGLAAGKAGFWVLSAAAAVTLVRRGFADMAWRALFFVNGVYVVAIGWNAFQVLLHAR